MRIAIGDLELFVEVILAGHEKGVAD